MQNKKHALAAAVLALAGGAAHAQSNVTIYGLADVGFSMERNSHNGERGIGIQSGMLSSSRLGFRGTEDLGNGLKAVWTLEAGTKLDTGTEQHPGSFFGRQSFVGLAGDFGALTLGRQYTPEDGINAKFDPFVHGSAGNAGNLMKAMAVRANNSVKYVSPRLAGFTGTLIYGFGEVTNNTEAGRYIGAGLEYSAGALDLGFSLEQLRDTADTTTGKKLQLAASYNFGVLKAYASMQDDRDVDGAVITRDARARQYLLGLKAPLGNAGTVLASVIHADGRDDANKNADMVAVGYTHALSKRTDLYAVYGHLNNRNGASFSLGNAQNAAMVAGADRAINLGLRHSF